jgi:CheY-like chemotaxis protein
MSSLLSGPILIVEDDKDIRESLQGFLELQGHEVVAVSHGKEALKQLQRLPRPALGGRLTWPDARTRCAGTS